MDWVEKGDTDSGLRADGVGAEEKGTSRWRHGGKEE